MMRFEFVAFMDDGSEVKLRSDGRDLRKWEAVYKRTMVGEHLSFTYLAQLCYLAMRRLAVAPSYCPTYELFDEHCENLDIERLDQEAITPNPTQSEPTPDSSAT